MFSHERLGTIEVFLGIEVARNESGFYLCQRKYAFDIITEMAMSTAKPASFPL